MSRVTGNQHKNEQGQTIVFMGIAIVALLGMLAIVVESGFIYIQRRSLQNAADAAALAGAQRLPQDPATAQTEAQSWATKNVSGLTTNTAVVFTTSGSPVSNDAITSTVKKKAATAFIGALSFGEPTISAHATARIRGAVLPGPGVFPVAISESTLRAQTGTLVTLKQTGGNGANGNYGLISLQNDKPGASVTCESVIGGSIVAITDPGTQSKPGNVSSLHNCLPVRMAAALANNCFTLAQVAPSGTLIDRCNPLIGAPRDPATGIQPTAVILIPVMTDASIAACSGRCDLAIVRAGDLRTFAFFHIDESTVNPVNGGPTCSKTGQCLIRGTFIMGWNAAVGASGQPIGNYTGAVVKVVQLVD